MVNDGSNIKINSERGDDLRSSKTGPSGKPKRDFKEVLRKEEGEGREREDKKDVSKEDRDVKGKENYSDVEDKLDAHEMKPKSKGVSLFELANTKEKAIEEAKLAELEEEIPITELSEEIQEESLSALFKGYGSKERLRAIQEEVNNAAISKENALSGKSPKEMNETPGESGKTALNLNRLASQDANQAKREPMEDLLAETSESGPKSPTTAEKSQQMSRFAQEQGDLSGVNPNAVAGAAQTSQVQGTQQPQSMAPTMKEIVDQIIDKLYTVDTSGKTDTLIKLKHPPLFAGSSVVITSYKSAKGEFNITFENLTQAAKQMLDMRENQEALKFALDQKGYTVHIITATTLTETVSVAEGKPREGESSEGGEGDAQREGKEKQEDQRQE